MEAFEKDVHRAIHIPMLRHMMMHWLPAFWNQVSPSEKEGLRMGENFRIMVVGGAACSFHAERIHPLVEQHLPLPVDLDVVFMINEESLPILQQVKRLRFQLFQYMENRIPVFVRILQSYRGVPKVRAITSGYFNHEGNAYHATEELFKTRLHPSSIHLIHMQVKYISEDTLHKQCVFGILDNTCYSYGFAHPLYHAERWWSHPHMFSSPMGMPLTPLSSVIDKAIPSQPFTYTNELRVPALHLVFLDTVRMMCAPDMHWGKMQIAIDDIYKYPIYVQKVVILYAVLEAEKEPERIPDIYREMVETLRKVKGLVQKIQIRLPLVRERLLEQIVPVHQEVKEALEHILFDPKTSYADIAIQMWRAVLEDLARNKLRVPATTAAKMRSQWVTTGGKAKKKSPHGQK